jgi:hypothetical protein
MSGEPLWVEVARECPSCWGPAEPEDDGETRFWACADPECGYEFGHLRLPAADPSCQLGVPEHVRRAASPPAARSEPFFPTIGRRPQ